jgi:hypothetical protein
MAEPALNGSYSTVPWRAVSSAPEPQGESLRACRILRVTFIVAPLIAGLDKFSDVLAGWLAGIIVNLLVLGSYFDIALRDLGLCLAAIALGRLSLAHPRPVLREED